MTHTRRFIGPLIMAVLAFPAACWAAPTRATANIEATEPDSLVSGFATFTPTVDGMEVTIRVAHIPPGAHGIHLHENGDCGDRGKAAGNHWNPHQVKHGFVPRDGVEAVHAGDLGNIEVNAKGTGALELMVKGLTLTDGPYSLKGRSIILHEKVDDFGQPTGNAGGRIGCGVIKIENN